MMSLIVVVSGNSKHHPADKNHRASLVAAAAVAVAWVVKAWVLENDTFKKRGRLLEEELLRVDLEVDNRTIQIMPHMPHQATVAKVSGAAALQITKCKALMIQRNSNSSHQPMRTTHGKNRRSLRSNYLTIISSLRKRRHLALVKAVSAVSKIKGINSTRRTTISLELTTKTSNHSCLVINRENRDQRRAPAPSRPSSTPATLQEANHQLLSDMPRWWYPQNIVCLHVSTRESIEVQVWNP